MLRARRQLLRLSHHRTDLFSQEAVETLWIDFWSASALVSDPSRGFFRFLFSDGRRRVFWGLGARAAVSAGCQDRRPVCRVASGGRVGRGDLRRRGGELCSRGARERLAHYLWISSVRDDAWWAWRSILGGADRRDAGGGKAGGAPPLDVSPPEQLGFMLADAEAAGGKVRPQGRGACRGAAPGSCWRRVARSQVAADAPGCGEGGEPWYVITRRARPSEGVRAAPGVVRWAEHDYGRSAQDRSRMRRTRRPTRRRSRSGVRC
jgi:hypothetical protein